MQIGQFEVPPGVVMHLHRVIQCICARKYRRTSFEAPEDKKLVKPRKMPDFPKKRVYGFETRAHQLLIIETVDQFQCPCPCVHQIAD